MTKELIKPKRRHKSYMPSEKSLANLKPFKPGENGQNGWSLKSELKCALNRPLKEPGEDATARERVVYSTIKGAISCEPSSAHLRELWDRVEGPVKDTHVENQDNRVLNVIVLNTETKDLIGKLAGWTVKPQVGRDATEQT